MKKLITCAALLLACLQVFSQEVQSAEQIQLNFFENKMNALGSNSPLNNQEKEKILTTFLALGKTSPEKGNDALFRIAVAQHTADTTKLYAIFKDEFDEALAIKYQAALEKYQSQYDVSDKQMAFFAPVLYLQTRDFRFNYYLSPDNEAERIRLDNESKKKYAPTLKFGQYSKNLDLISLNDEVYTSILNYFINLTIQSDEKGYKEMFTMAVCTVITDSARICTVFKDEIEAEAKKKYKADLAKERKKYNLSEEQSKLISKKVLNNAKRVALYKYLYKNNEKELDKKLESAKINCDKSIQIILTEQGIKTNLSNYCTVLNYKDQLALTQDQVDEVLSAGWNLYQRYSKNKNINLRNQEHKITKGILNDEQYDKYLSYRVIGRAKEETQAIWLEAAQLGLTAELDSAQVYPQLLGFNLEKAKIRERYKIIPGGQQERDDLLKNLNDNKPKALKKIQTVRNRESAKRNQDRNTVVW